MKSKEFIAELATRSNLSVKETNQLVVSLINEMSSQLTDNNTIAIHGFGTSEVIKKAERITVNPVAKQRLLIPPKLVLSFRQSTTLKEKFK